MKQLEKSAIGLKWLILSVLVFGIDMFSKYLIMSYLYYQSIDILPFFSITYAQNTGAAFSILEGQRTLLATVAIVVSAYIVYMLYENGSTKKFENFSLALILGGALGNLLDRLYHGFVIDFLDVKFGTWHYPTFNIADCAICVGIGIYIFSYMRTLKRRKKSNETNIS